MKRIRQVITQVRQFLCYLQPLLKDRTDTSRYGLMRRVQIDDSTDTDRDELVSNRELYIYSSDDDSQLTFRQQL